MRVWDVNPGYLNRQSLLGEHREIHGVFVVITAGKKGYARHPGYYRQLGPLVSKNDHKELFNRLSLEFLEKIPNELIFSPLCVRY